MDGVDGKRTYTDSGFHCKRHKSNVTLQLNHGYSSFSFFFFFYSSNEEYIRVTCSRNVMSATTVNL